MRFLAFIAVTAALLAPTSLYAQANGNMEGWPEWVQEGMAKELRKSKLRQVKMPIETISIKLPGKPAPAEPIEDGWYINSDIKAGSPLECYIYTTALDLASLTNILAENNIAAVAEGSGGEVGIRNVHYTDAGVVDGYPYMALEWVYTVVTGTETQVGFTKVRTAAKGDIAFACAHNYLGYRETFAKAFSDFVENAEYEVPSPAPYYEEISTIDFNGMNAGVIYFSFAEDDEGDIEIFTAEATILPVDASTIVASDGITISYTAPDGELYNSIAVNVENGEITSNLRLERNDENAWFSGGTMQGKQVETILDGEISPASDLHMIATARDLFAGDDTAATLDIWVPSADPTRFLQATFTRDDAEVERQAQVSLGPLNFVGQFDEHGNLANSVMAVGPVTVEVSRIWSAGTPSR